MTGPLKGQNVLAARAGPRARPRGVLAARDAGATVVATGRQLDTLDAAYAGEPGVTTQIVDLTEEASIAVLGDRLGSVDHVVSTASTRARDRQDDLDRDAVRLFAQSVAGDVERCASIVFGVGRVRIAQNTVSARLGYGVRATTVTRAEDRSHADGSRHGG